MSNWVLILLLVLLLTAAGSLALLLVTIKYYWGERGTAPPSREQRRRKRAKELELRAKQIAYSESNPITARSPDFLDNRKRPPGREQRS